MSSVSADGVMAPEAEAFGLYETAAERSISPYLRKNLTADVEKRGYGVLPGGKIDSPARVVRRFAKKSGGEDEG